MAIKFTPAGGNVYFGVDTVTSSNLNQSRDMLKLTVKDTGVGIEGEKLPRIFDRFY